MHFARVGIRGTPIKTIQELPGCVAYPVLVPGPEDAAIDGWVESVIL